MQGVYRHGKWSGCPEPRAIAPGQRADRDAQLERRWLARAVKDTVKRVAALGHQFEEQYRKRELVVSSAAVDGSQIRALEFRRHELRFADRSEERRVGKEC